MNTRLVAALPVRAVELLPERIRSVGADLVELRLDYLDDLGQVDMGSLAEQRDRLILTVRSVEEGGINQHPRETKAAFLRRASGMGFTVDIEGSFVNDMKLDLPGAIVSRHYTDRDPSMEELCSFVDDFTSRAGLVKIVLRASHDSRMKLLRLLDRYRNRPLAVMELDGEPMTRILFSLMGSCLVYCHEGEKTSPGQLPCSEAREIMAEIKRLEK